jgi:protein-tyrosine-phosphatase
VDLSSHVARRITEEDLIRFDWILTLAPEIDDELWELPWMDEKYRTKIRTLEGLSLELGISLPREIQDPWYGGPQDFEKCFQTLKHTAQALVTSMKQITNGKV